MEGPGRMATGRMSRGEAGTYEGDRAAGERRYSLCFGRGGYRPL